jgi:hypothetical protein
LSLHAVALKEKLARDLIVQSDRYFVRGGRGQPNFRVIFRHCSAADRIVLSPEQIERLNNLTPAAGERHDEGNMAVIDR